MAKIHDKYVIELAEVIKGYGNDPDVEDPIDLSSFYRFYELPNIAIHRENFLKMKPLEPRKGKWMRADTQTDGIYECSVCLQWTYIPLHPSTYNYCPRCGSDMRGEEE